MMKTQNWFYPMGQGNSRQRKSVHNHLQCKQVSRRMYYQLGSNNEGNSSLCACKYDEGIFVIFKISDFPHRSKEFENNNVLILISSSKLYSI